MAVHIQLLDWLISFMHTRRGKIATGLLVIFLSIIIILPHLISHLVRDWFDQHGSDQTQIEDVNFNLFTGKIEFINLRVMVADDYTLLVKSALANSDWLPLFNKTFYIKELFIENTLVNLEKTPEGKVQVAGINIGDEQQAPTPPQADTSDPWHFGLEKLTILNTRINYRQADLSIKLEVDNASLTALHSARSEAAKFILAGKLNDSPLTINADLTPFADQAGADTSLSLQALQLVGLKQLASTHADIEGGTLSVDIKMKARYNEKTGLQLDESGLISLADVAILQAGSRIKAGSINWQGSFNTTLDNSNQLKTLLLSGDLSANEVSALHDKDNSELLSIKSLTVDKVELTQQQLAINDIKVATLVANLQRDANGAIILPQADEVPVDKTESTEHSTAIPETEAASPTLDIRIGHINITDKSTINFTDQSTTPAFASAITLNSVDISSLDSRQPDIATSIKLDGTIGKFSTLQANGFVKPFLEKPSLDLTTEIKAMELPPLSSYTSGMLGHNMLNGQLNTTTKVTIVNDKIDGLSKLLIGNLDVKELTPEEKKKINTTASAPLSLGLSMLRDRDNNVKLDLPIKGDMNDPKLDISDAINQAVGTAISKASLTYLTLALQPFGALVAIADIAGDISKGVQLQPVLFISTSTALSHEAIQYKEKIAAILTDRPQLRIKVCGIATSRDRNALVARQLEILKAEKAMKKQAADPAKPTRLPVIPDSILLEIASKRADNLKAALINDHKIQPDRLFGCLPIIDKEAGTDPRVEIGI